MRVLVTGAAGFVGRRTVIELLDRGHLVTGIDNFEPYYARDLKEIRLSSIRDVASSAFDFYEVDLSRDEELSVIQSRSFDAIIHLAAQPGVRHPPVSFPRTTEVNVLGSARVFDLALRTGSSTVLYASSSSVYGDLAKLPFRESEVGLKPKSFYGASKLAVEVLARNFSIATGLKTRGLRFFTVYGPMGRPDMAYFRLAAAALGEWEFSLSCELSTRRDFTFVDDTARSTVSLLDEIRSRPEGFYDVVNVGGGNARSMSELIEISSSGLETINSDVRCNEVDADVVATEADFSYLLQLIGIRPQTSLEEGMERVRQWSSSKLVRPNLRRWIMSVAGE